MKPAEKHDQRRASGAAVQMGKNPESGPGPGLESQPGTDPKSGSGFGHEAEPQPGPEPAPESQKTAANNQVEGIDVADVLPPAGANSELQPQDQARPGEIPAAAAAAAAEPPSGQEGVIESEPSELKGEESKSRVSPSESEVKQLDSSSR